MDEIAKLYQTLRNSESLKRLLYDGENSIRPDITLYSGEYPIVVYQVISDVPHLFGDDQELAQRITVQLSVLTLDGDDAEIISILNKVMKELEWIRITTTRITEESTRISAIRYVKAIQESEETA